MTIQIHRKIKLIGFPLSLSMIQNTIADCQKNGLNMETTLLQEDFALFQVKGCGTTKMEEVIGDQYWFMLMIQIDMFTLELGMMIKMDIAN